MEDERITDIEFKTVKQSEWKPERMSSVKDFFAYWLFIAFVLVVGYFWIGALFDPCHNAHKAGYECHLDN